MDTSQDLVFYLGRQGFALHPVTLTVPAVLDVAGQVYQVQPGDYLAVYEFDSPQQAARGADAFTLDTFGGGTSSLYQRGPVLVAYSGNQSSLQLALTRALGQAVH